MSLKDLTENKNTLFGISLITSLLGGIFFIIDDFTAWYWRAGTVEGWGWIGIPSIIENIFEGYLDAFILLPIFLAVTASLFYSTVISILGLINKENPPSKQLIFIGMILAASVFVISLIGGLVAIISFITDELDDWWFGGAFYGGLLGGALTSFFMYLIWRDY